MKTPFSVLFASLVISLGSSYGAPILSEIVSDNQNTLQDEDGEFVDWIELYNPEDSPYSLDGHFLTDDADDLTQWMFPDVSVPPGGYLIVFASSKNRQDPESELHSSFGVSNDGEFLALVGPDGEELISDVVVPPMEVDQSFIAVEADGGYVYQVSFDPTPGAANSQDVVLFSLHGQSFTEPLTLELSSPGGKPISYTLDGRTPSLFNQIEYSEPISIDGTTIVTARAGSTGALRTETFIRIDPTLADRSSDIPLVIIDTFGTPLTQTSLRNMAIGIQDREEGGRAQLLGEFETHSRGGARTRGETSNSFPKKPMRFEFWDGEGEDRSLAPLGMPADGDWILNARYEFDRSLMRNAWIYRLSNEIGRYAVRTRFVELYLNDDGGTVEEANYEGVYTFMETIERNGERVDVASLEIEDTEEPTITGGYIFRKDKDDPGTWNFSGGGEPLQMIEPPTDEQNERQHQEAYLVDYLNRFNNETDNPDPETGYPSFIDVEAWIDHHLLNVLTLNVDALRLSAYFHKDREGKLVAGPIWDFDRSAGSTDGRSANPELWRGQGGDLGTHFFATQLGTPRWWADLFQERDFQQAWADRWHELRKGAFSEENIHRIVDEMAAELNEAQERNFNKWTAVRPRGGYDGEINILKNWLSDRVAWIDSELVRVPTITPVDPVGSGPFNVTIQAGGSVFNPAVVYYTTDGSDPRLSGGEISENAILYDGSFEVSSTVHIISRKLDLDYTPSPNGPDQEWSAPAEKVYFVGEEPANAENLVVSEIMYHPADPTEDELAAGFEDPEFFEFIELMNIGEVPVVLSGVRFTNGIDFSFEDGTALGVGEHLLLVADQAAFEARYGTSVSVDGVYEGRLSNSGETLKVEGLDGAEIKRFSYSDQEPWPAEADGEGMSLVLLGHTENPDPALAESWTTGKLNGTPGTGEDGGNGGSGFEDWREEHFTAEELADPAISGLAADPDNDGVPNLGEYASGGDPQKADTNGLPVVTVSIDSEEEYLTVSYLKAMDATEVTIALEVSSDLENWLGGEENVVELSRTPQGDGTELVLVRDTTPLSDESATERFARLRFSQN